MGRLLGQLCGRGGGGSGGRIAGRRDLLLVCPSLLGGREG